MEHRDYNYYEANAATVNLGEITSSAKNATNLQRLRDGDPKLHCLILGGRFSHFHDVSEDDDWGWLGYFISKSENLRHLGINYLPGGEEGHAFADIIVRNCNQSIRSINIDNLNNDTFTTLIRVLRSLSILEELSIWGENNVGPDGWSELGTLLESGVCKLKELCLCGNSYIGNEGMDVLSNGLAGIGSSLNVLRLEHNSIGNQALSTLVEALQTCTGIEKLYLSGNDFSSAAAGLGSLSDWLLSDEVNLHELKLSYCRMNDEGLHELFQGVANCKELDLEGNESITSTGLSYLSNAIRSDSCRVETLHLQHIPVGVEDDGLEILALGLADNKSVRSLYLEELGDDISVTSAGWVAFSRALCDTSSVNSTYLSNHSIRNIWAGDAGEYIPHQEISLYLQLNGEHPQYAARCKILMNHRHLNMAPFLQWKMKFLPLAVAWFERAKPCTTLTIYEGDYDHDLSRRVLDESDEAFESRALTAMYEFVRGMPMEVMKRRRELIVSASYDKKIARIEEENKIALEQRDRKNLQLEEEIARLKIENKRLSGIVEAVRKNVGF